VNKTVIYTRQSLGKDKQKNSTDVQEKICLKLAQKKGLLVHEYYNEGEQSARITGIRDRPEMVRLLHAADKGEVSRLIVYKRDRLARNVEQYMEILNTLQRAGVEILFAADNEPPLLSGPIGEFVEMILAGLAQQEGENIHLRQMEARRHNAEKGKRSAGSAPFGYVIDEGKLKRIEKNKSIIKNVYDLFNECWSEKLSLREIVKIMKYRAKEEEKPNISSQFVKEIIPRTIHKGWQTQNESGKPISVEVEGTWIVSESVWQEANKKLEFTCPDVYEKKENKKPYQALLLDKIICVACSDSSKKKVYLVKKKVNYVCENCSRQRNTKDFDQHILESVLNKLIETASSNEERIKDFLTNHFLFYPRKETKKLRDRLLKLEEEIKENMEIMLSGSDCEKKIHELTCEYQETYKRLIVIEDHMFQIEQAILLHQPDRYVSELKVERLTHDQKGSLLATVKEVSDEESHSIIHFADGEE
jgi:site-specific DNA recombinase